DEHLAVVAAVRVDAGEDLEQRRLAGAVLAAQAEDLAGARLERGAVERDDAAKALADAAHDEARGLAGRGHFCFDLLRSRTARNSHGSAIIARVPPVAPG